MMERRINLRHAGLLAAVALLASGCGGGGSPARPPAIAPTLPPGESSPAPLPTLTATPLQSVPGRNQVSQSSAAGSMTLRVESIVLTSGQTTHFSVFLFDNAGHP